MLSTPGLIKNLAYSDQIFSALEPVPLDRPPYNEDWLQNLIQTHPGLIPASDIEACFSNLVPVLREFTLPSGFLDNFFVTPDGYPVLVEVKLWKNQEARRKVIAQILEYAKDFAALSYDDINAEIHKQNKGRTWGANPLHEIVATYTAEMLDESLFVDRVSRNLREGRFLLLILGDGVREEMAALANYLMHHSLRYAFGIIETKLFTLPDGSAIILPSVLAKTQTIERHVTVVTAQGDNISVLPHAPVITSEKLEKTSLSLDNFYENLAKTAPDSVSWIKDVIQSLDGQVAPQVGLNGDSLMLKAMIEHNPTLMFINPPNADFWGLTEGRLAKTPERKKVAEEYLDRIAALVSGEVKVFPAGGKSVRVNGKAVPLHSFIGKGKELKDAMLSFIQGINALSEE
jgi:hypothetical protein